MKKQDLHEPFLEEQLNPLFLQALQTYWNLSSQTPQQSHLKENLQRFLLRRLFQPLYLAHSPKAQGSLFFVSHILPDGIGDYYALLQSAQVLKNAHPHLNVEAVYLCHSNLPQIDPTLAPDQIYPFQNSPLLETILEGKLSENLLQLEQDQETFRKAGLTEFLTETEQKIAATALYQKMQKSLAIVHIALALNTFENPLLAPKSLYFAEAGNFQGIGNLLKYNWFSMGLQPFEEGLFLKESPQSNPDKTQHVGYFAKPSLQPLIFLYLIALQQKNDPRSISLFTTPLKQQMDFNIPFLKEQGIARVTLQEKTLLETGLKSSKTLMILPILPLPHADFKRLLASSGPIVGCTGDGSLSNCLAANKIPFYELRKHKKETWQMFQEIARFLQLPTLLDYMEGLKDLSSPPEQTAQKLHQILQRNEFQKEWDQFLHFIKKYGSFEDALLSHLNRHLSTFAKKEEKIIQDYLQQHISAEQAYHLVKKELNN